MRYGLAAALAGAVVVLPVALLAQSSRPVPFTETAPAPPLPADVADDLRKTRNYPEQPPVIPHSIRDYQIDLNSNRCMTCHTRQYTEASQAPMISVTHYVDRNGQTLATVSPRRYFCTECHVPQTNAKPTIENHFVDIDALLTHPPASRGR
jgi:nitrate reductase (cytochrome), electron transfer subunit